MSKKKTQTQVELEYTHEERIRFGLIAVFPNLKAYHHFVRNERGDAGPFIRLASENGILEGGNKEKAFEAFIKANALKPQQYQISTSQSFSALLEDKNIIKTSIRGLTDWINELIVKFQLESMFPAGRVSNVTFSRLQREPVNSLLKRNTLRLLSFWFGYKRPHLGPQWTYETLLGLCPKEHVLESDHGVRIAFDLYSRGDVIETRSVKWLTNEVRQCVKDLALYRYTRIQSINTTSFYLDLPKEDNMQSDIDHPGSYGRCIKDAISIAHQVSVRWALSPHSSPRRTLIIGIAAGELAGLDIYLQSIIRAKLPMDPVIRMTDYAHLCVLVNDIRATFAEVPKEIEMSNGELINIWWVTGLWNTNFWDLVPQLLDDKMLQAGLQADLEFRKLLWSLSEQGETAYKKKALNAITSFLSHPQDSMLGLEIARTLYFRKRLKAADEIISIILSADPSNLPARSLRMEICWLLGIEAPTYSISELHFKQAEKEASLINEICTTRIEDFYSEYALGKMGRAMLILRLIRKGRGRYEDDGFSLHKEDVLQLLEEAENLFETGMALSSRGHRSNFFLLCTRSLKRILISDPEIFINPEKKILDKQDLSRKAAIDIYFTLGWLSSDYPIEVQFPVFIKFLLNAINNYDESIFLRTSIPNIKFHFASILLDFSPILNVGVVKTVLTWLRQANELAREYGKDDLYLLSSLRSHKEIIPPDTFIQYIEQTINEVEARLGKLEDLEDRDDDEPIATDQLEGLKLFSLNVG